MEDANPFLQKIKKQWRHFASAWKGVKRGTDVDSLHDLRGATRRLAALLILLQSIVDDDRIEHIRRQFKKLQKRLGPIRDAQVQLMRIQRNPPESLQPLQRSLKKNVREKELKLKKHLTERRRKKLRQTLKDVEREARQALKAASPAAIDRKVRPVIDAAVNDLMVAQSAVSMSDPASLHALRRAARQLRYLLESGVVSTGAVPAGQLKILRSFQSKLGDVRDLQLLEDKIQSMSKGVKSAPDRADIDRYRRGLARQRMQELKAFSLQFEFPDSSQPARTSRPKNPAGFHREGSHDKMSKVRRRNRRK